MNSYRYAKRAWAGLLAATVLVGAQQTAAQIVPSYQHPCIFSGDYEHGDLGCLHGEGEVGGIKASGHVLLAPDHVGVGFQRSAALGLFEAFERSRDVFAAGGQPQVDRDGLLVVEVETPS